MHSLLCYYNDGVDVKKNVEFWNLISIKSTGHAIKFTYEHGRIILMQRLDKRKGLPFIKQGIMASGKVSDNTAAPPLVAGRDLLHPGLAFLNFFIGGGDRTRIHPRMIFSNTFLTCEVIDS